VQICHEKDILTCKIMCTRGSVEAKFIHRSHLERQNSKLMCNIKGKNDAWSYKVVDFKCGFSVERQHGCNMQCNRQTDGQTCVSSAAGEHVNSSAAEVIV